MRIPIYSIVAYSGTGKTTLIEKLIPALGARGLRVAVIKHDAHEFDIDRKGKDSWRFTKAGAAVTVVVSATKAAIMENRPVPIERLIEQITDVDVIITEGYKHGPWPKIALMRSGNNKPLPLPPEECLAVMADVTVDTDVPLLPLGDAEALADFLLRDMRENARKE
ncbi:MAG TPA: molybdopterin-guanine dinucleotide biosynthesis protein B [Papillibacter sp.]|nr:molybdopterin-guanine dinucleotide biosynthesis protein B [Papillibacter sp.]